MPRVKKELKLLTDSLIMQNYNKKELEKKERAAFGATPPAPYSDEVKHKAVELYLTMGDKKLVAAMLGIHEKTMQSWSHSEWWKSLIEAKKIKDQIILSQDIKTIVNKSFEAISDRLENGDYIYDQKTGKMKRKPVTLRDAAATANIMMNQRAEAEKRQITPTGTVESAEQKLKNLASKFAEMALQQMKKPVEVTDVIEMKTVAEEEEDAIYDEREEGLQEGSELGEEDSSSEGSSEG